MKQIHLISNVFRKLKNKSIRLWVFLFISFSTQLISKLNNLHLFFSQFRKLVGEIFFNRSCFKTRIIKFYSQKKWQEARENKTSIFHIGSKKNCAAWPSGREWNSMSQKTTHRYILNLIIRKFFYPYGKCKQSNMTTQILPCIKNVTQTLRNWDPHKKCDTSIVRDPHKKCDTNIAQSRPA